MSDAMCMKSLQPGYRRDQRRRRKALVDAAFHLAFVVRNNIGRKVKRGAIPSERTMKLDRIRDALARLDEIRRERN
jgi:hypothetical protein